MIIPIEAKKDFVKSQQPFMLETLKKTRNKKVFP